MEKLTLQSHGASELSFKDRYEALDKIPTPKQEFVRRIANATERTEQTVYNWLRGTFSPDKLCKKAISKELGAPIEILFPAGESCMQ